MLRTSMLKYVGVMCHNVYNLLSKIVLQKVCVHVKREGRRKASREGEKTQIWSSIRS